MRYLLSDGRYVGVGTAFTFNDVQYPANWFNLATDKDLASIGATLVTYTNERADDRFYVVTESLSGSEITYVNTPKDLAELKDREVKNINRTAYSILQPTDYIDPRNLRDPSYKPEWTVWRESVLTAARAGVAAVLACVSVEELAALPSVVWPHDPNYVAPVIEETPVNV